jgi:T5SS/PEP-CTERM-associated repeat protein
MGCGWQAEQTRVKSNLRHGGWAAACAAVLMVSGGAALAENGVTNVISGVSSNYLASYYYVGSNGAFNALIVTNASALLVSSGSGIIGNSAISSNNTALVTGSGSIWSNSLTLTVGNTGSFNSLTIANGGHVFDHAGYIGYDPTASNNWVQVSGTGSVWSNVSSALYVGYYGSDNGLVISNRGRVFNTLGYIGYMGAASNNTVLVTGVGSLWSNSSTLYIGNNNSSGNSLVITNGGTVVDVNGTFGYGAGNNTVLVTGVGSLWSNSSTLWFSNYSSGNSLIIANGGRVVDSNGTFGTYVNNNAVLVTGAGSLWSNNNALTLGNYYGGGNSLTIANSGRVVDSSGYIGYYGYNNTGMVTGAGSF